MFVSISFQDQNFKLNPSGHNVRPENCHPELTSTDIYWYYGVALLLSVALCMNEGMATGLTSIHGICKYLISMIHCDTSNHVHHPCPLLG